MKRIFIFTIITIMLLGCGNTGSNNPNPTRAIQTTISDPSSTKAGWNIYDPDPNHLWNRVFRQFYRRVAKDGKEYGMDELDPLLWFDTVYLLQGESHQEAIHVLNDYINSNAETLIHDPLKRALFQHDLWAVFDWLAFQPETYPSQREALKTRIARIIRRVALTKDEILSLPDNYKSAVESKAFPSVFQIAQPYEAFLPSDLFQLDGAWIPMDREGGPIAMSHTNEFPFFGRSVFLVFVRSPDGREATLDLIESLNIEPQFVLTMRLDVALVRRMLLIDNEGKLVLSPLIETIQIRHFNPEQIFHEFELDRGRLINGDTDTFNLKTHLFMLFFSHGDVFEREHGPELQATIPDICKACHFNETPHPNYGNTQSIISVSRSNFPLPNNERPVLMPTNWESEAQVIIEWKHNHHTWKELQNLWRQENP